MGRVLTGERLTLIAALVGSLCHSLLHAALEKIDQAAHAEGRKKKKEREEDFWNPRA